MKVLCFGSLNIDYTYKVEHFVKKGETLSSDGLGVYGGGKGLKSVRSSGQSRYGSLSCRCHWTGWNVSAGHAERCRRSYRSM